jgi:hypothetical protein
MDVESIIEDGVVDQKELNDIRKECLGDDGEIDSKELERISYYAKKFSIDFKSLTYASNAKIITDTPPQIDNKSTTNCLACNDKGCMLCH